MPWESKTVEKIRSEFVAKLISGNYTKSELCREYGISRPTGDKWLNRYKSGEGFSNKSHEPFKKPNKTPPNQEALILETRDYHPTWGARKLHRYLSDKGYNDLPATSTISDILKRNGKISTQESIAHTAFKRFERSNPNELWQMDFKGHFGMSNGSRCHPLTILDDHSRFSLCTDAKEDERWTSVKVSLARVFKEYGLPCAILCDNGKPWGDSKQGYTQFEMWMMQMNVLPIHGRPLHPQTQGKEERFHRTLNEDLLKRVIIKDIPHAQEEFDMFRWIYNNERPHNALNLDTPIKHYRISKRKLPTIISEPEYDQNKQLRKVNYKGYISISRQRYYLSEVFIGKYLELVHDSDEVISLCYGNFKVAQIDLADRAFISKKIFRR